MSGQPSVEDGGMDENQKPLRDELPGMWEDADLVGGEADSEQWRQYDERERVTIEFGQQVHRVWGQS